LVVEVAGDRKFGLAWLLDESARAEFGGDAWHLTRVALRAEGSPSERGELHFLEHAPVIACDWLQTLCARDTT
jgi:hypothetical protein